MNNFTDYQFPTSAGVYFFKNIHNQIIYIGKAKHLKNRIQSYFYSSDFKVIELMKVAISIEFITTHHEIEALFLEAQLIKQHQPIFNRLLKAGNPYTYIFISDESLPTILIVRSTKKKGYYFGPFLSQKDARIVVDYLAKNLQLNVCHKKIESGCLQYHINICAGSCKNDFDVTKYIARLTIARYILDGNYTNAIENLDAQIEINNKALEFEKSAHLTTYRKHLLAMSKTLKILETTKFTNLTSFAKMQSKYQKIQEDGQLTLLIELKARLGLSKIPYTIDCFDISHMQSQSIVGSAVRFLNGKPDKKNFRHFKITGMLEQNDYAALAQIVTRRYKKIENIPDLIIIDGGVGQLNATKNIISIADIISIAKGDGRKVGAETIFFKDNDKNPLPIDIHQKTDQLLLQIRDYAHHFAISYHRKKQKITT